MLASGSADTTIKLWNKATGNLLRTLNQGSQIWCVAFENTNVLASGSWNRNIKLWNKNTGDLLRTITVYSDTVRSVAFDNTNKNTGDLLITLSSHQENEMVGFGPNNILASCGVSTITLWNKNTGDLLRNLSGHQGTIMSVAFDNNNMLASCSNDKTIKLWGA